MHLPDASRLPRFARTVTFKLALLQAGLFAASAAILFVAVYWTMVGYARTQLRTSIAAEYATLAEERSSDGLDDLVRTIDTRTRDRDTRGFVYLLRAVDGRTLAGGLDPAAVRAGWQDLVDGDPKRDGPRHLEVLARELPDGEVLAVARDVGDVDGVKERLIGSFGAAAALTLALAILSGVLSSQGALRRVEAINAITQGIIEGDLGRRLPERGSDDEFDRLAFNTNAMLDRIQTLMEGLRQVSNDIAHDLRTPLTHLRQRLDAAREGPRSVDAYEAAIEAASGDADALLRIFASLLRIAQVEAGTRRGGFADVDLSAVFSAIAEAYEPVADDAGQRLTATVVPGLSISGDRVLLTQMLANLVENAIRHAGSGACIAVSLRGDDAGFLGTVADTGPGIPADQRARVFGRFVRLEASRSGEGNGLGLAMVKAIADLHGVDVALSGREPGLAVTLRGAALTHPAEARAGHGAKPAPNRQEPA